MSRAEHTFLFTSSNAKRPTTARKVHIRRLIDILQLSLQRQDYDRARRAWTILIRCKEINWKDMWKTAIALLADAGDDDLEENDQRIAFLSVVIRQHPDEREMILKELVLRLIQTGKYRRALDELDLYLPLFPFHDNPVMHTYAGLLALYLSQPAQASEGGTQQGQQWNAGLISAARAHFERARWIDPGNTIANAFLEQLPNITRITDPRQGPESDDEGEDRSMEVDDMSQRRKRVKT
ncbi:uncharacterized protein C8Q71DRAFT_29459 [Rhodofomes roseus]|uniref:Tetratricopeptide repeat protein n=1 Tax=Rhodofomes roseus TaxID=34475 RepID=A0ABQ8L0D3_9APHY|nr:uncharacterized protein C8Q71DRAFT_29459 [Rhodofomes roseus]KAH9844087.1 hypothetical protein C8Q71DRAFT_29459 [Rhodofomes roseus]